MSQSSPSGPGMETPGPTQPDGTGHIETRANVPAPSTVGRVLNEPHT